MARGNRPLRPCSRSAGLAASETPRASPPLSSVTLRKFRGLCPPHGSSPAPAALPRPGSQRLCCPFTANPVTLRGREPGKRPPLRSRASPSPAGRLRVPPPSVPPSRRPPLSPPPAVCAEAAGARDCGSGGDAARGGDAAGPEGSGVGRRRVRPGPRSDRRCPCPLGTAPGPGPARRRHGRDQQPRSCEEAAGKHAGGPAGPEPGVPEKIPPRQGGEWR